MRYLRNADVARLVTPAAALAAVRDAFAELAAGTAAVQPRVRTTAGGAKLSTLGAVLDGAGVLGAKAYATVEGRFTFLVVLFAAADGRLLAVLQSDELTRLRTAATSVLSTEVLHPTPPRTLVVCGTGAQATAHGEAFARRFPLERIRFVGRNPRPTVARDLVVATGVDATSLPLEQAAAAVANADVVVTATRASSPVLRGEWLAPGTHVCAVGSSLPTSRELDDEVYRRARVIAVELAVQAREEAGGLVQAVERGVVAWDDVSELAALLGGRPGAVRHGGDVTVMQSVGIGLEDVAVAAAAWREAEAVERTVG